MENNSATIAAWRGDLATGALPRTGSKPVIVKAISQLKTSSGARNLAAYIGRLWDFADPYDRDRKLQDSRPRILDEVGEEVAPGDLMGVIRSWDLLPDAENLAPLARQMADKGESLDPNSRFRNVQVRHFVFSAPISREADLQELEIDRLEAAVSATVSEIFTRQGYRSIRATHREHAGHPHIHVAIKAKSEFPPFRRLVFEPNGSSLDRIRYVFAEECRRHGLQDVDATRWSDRRDQILRILDGEAPVPAALSRKVGNKAPPRKGNYRHRYRLIRDTRPLSERVRDKAPIWAESGLRHWTVRRAEEELARVEGLAARPPAFLGFIESGERARRPGRDGGGTAAGKRPRGLLSRALEYYGFSAEAPAGPEKQGLIDVLRADGLIEEADLAGAADRMRQLADRESTDLALRLYAELPGRYGRLTDRGRRHPARKLRQGQDVGLDLSAVRQHLPERPEADTTPEGLTERLAERFRNLGVFVDWQGRDHSREAVNSFIAMHAEEPGFARWCLIHQPRLFGPVTELAEFLQRDKVTKEIVKRLPASLSPLRLEQPPVAAGGDGLTEEQRTALLDRSEIRRARESVSRHWVELGARIERHFPTDYARRQQAVTLSDMAARAQDGQKLGGQETPGQGRDIGGQGTGPAGREIGVIDKSRQDRADPGKGGPDQPGDRSGVRPAGRSGPDRSGPER